MNTDKKIADAVDNHFGKFKCDFEGCTRRFPSPVGLRMHRIRAHIKPWSTTGNFHKVDNPKTPEERLAQQRAYNKKWRARMVARGLTAAGKPRVNRQIQTPINPEKPHWEQSAYRKRKYREQVARYHARGLNAHGQPFKNNAISRGLRKAAERRGGWKLGRKKRFKPFVYPVPGQNNVQEEPAQPTQEAAAPEWIHAQLHYCPHCGEKLTAWKKE